MDQFKEVHPKQLIIPLLQMLTLRMYPDRLNDFIDTFVDKLSNVAIQILIFLSIDLS